MLVPPSPLRRLSDRPRVLLGHSAYALGPAFSDAGLGLPFEAVSTREDFAARIGEAEIAVTSDLWDNAFLTRTPKLVLVHSCSVGTDQYDKAAFAAAGVTLTNSQGSNEVAVAEHAFALLLALTRQIHTGRDNQARRHWRELHTRLEDRETELDGKTLAIVGFGCIGRRIGRIARAFGMRVIGVRRSPEPDHEAADEVTADLHGALRRAQVAILVSPLTAQTERMIDAAALAALPRGAILINVGRGRVVDEPALVDAIRSGHVAAAGLDCVAIEPLPRESPLWTMENVLVTPHSAGETPDFERRVIEALVENIARLHRGEHLLNRIA